MKLLNVSLLQPLFAPNETNLAFYNLICDAQETFLPRILEKSPAERKKILVCLIENGMLFSAPWLLKFMELPEASCLLKAYIKKKGKLPESVEIKIFNLPDAEKILTAYMRSDAEISPEGMRLLINQPYAEHLLKIYVNRGNTISEEALFALLETPMAPEIYLVLIKNNHHIPDEVWFEILAKPYAAKLLDSIEDYDEVLGSAVKMIAKYNGLISF